MLRMPWMAKMMNQEVLKKISCNHRLVMSLKAIALKHKLKYFGRHAQQWVRKEPDDLHGGGKKRTTKNKVDGWC